MQLFKNFFKKIALLLAIYLTSRVFFLVNNFSTFNNSDFVSLIFAFFESFRFDLSILFYINSIVLFLIFFPTNFRSKRGYQKIVKTIFLIVNIPFIIINNIDIEFYQYNQKRITSDFIDLLFFGNDTLQVLPSYLLTYWPILVLTVFQTYLLIKFSDFKTNITISNYKSFFKSTTAFLAAIILFVFCARGGAQLKPINTINAGELSNPFFSNLILNTPFTFLHSFKSEKLIPYEYFSDEKLENNFSLKRTYVHEKSKKNNVVIIIMESLSKEFVGFYNKHNLTPFLDSLMNHSLIFNNTYSNGLRSIEALPAITASIPTLSNTPFISSVYAQNKFNSLASILSEDGYSTSFFHGGTRGTMGFYSFCKKAGFQSYYGLEEYNDNKDYDGTWGIYDEPFFKFFAKKLKEEKKPFFSTFFSLSAHPPYNIPIKHKNKFKDGELDIHKLISYSDYSLGVFFNSIKNEEWFKNTLFVITADHTSPKSTNDYYKNKIGRYSIPMLFYMHNSDLVGVNDTVAQHIDVMPSVLDLLGYSDTFYSFGESVFRKNSWSIHHINNRYCLITDQAIISNRDERYSSFSDWKLKNKIENDSSDIVFLKAFKQLYSQKMIKNNLVKDNFEN